MFHFKANCPLSQIYDCRVDSDHFDQKVFEKNVMREETCFVWNINANAVLCFKQESRLLNEYDYIFTIGERGFRLQPRRNAEGNVGGAAFECAANRIRLHTKDTPREFYWETLLMFIYGWTKGLLYFTKYYNLHILFPFVIVLLLLVIKYFFEHEPVDSLGDYAVKWLCLCILEMWNRTFQVLVLVCWVAVIRKKSLFNVCHFWVPF